MRDNKLHTPDGVKDYLPAEYSVKRELEKRMECVFNSYGYSCVSSPTFEYMEVFDGKGSVSSRQMYKFLDRSGEILALRSDMTLAIARIAATAYGPSDMPLRFHYFENAFRYNESYQGKLKEFTQAGVELIGVNSNDADAEVIAVAINSLLAAGITEFRLDIGQVDFFRGLLLESALDSDTCLDIQNFILNKEYTGVFEIINKCDLKDGIKQLFMELPLLIGSKAVIDKVKPSITNEKSLRALNDLENIYDILCDYGLNEYIRFDLSMVGHLDYYTGLIFRGYISGTGVSVIDGGRYDSLISKFGGNYPSVGFAIKVNELLNKMDANAVNMTSSDTLLAYTEKGRKSALLTADELRTGGLKIENSLAGYDLDKSIEYAKARNMDGILFFLDDQNIKLINLKENTETQTTIEELLHKGNDSPNHNLR